MDESWETVYLCDLSFAVFDLQSEAIATYDPESRTRITVSDYWRGAAERAVTTLYEEVLNWRTCNIENERRSNPLKYALGIEECYTVSENAPDIPGELTRTIVSDIESVVPRIDDQLGELQRDGIPDLVVFSRNEPSKYAFVEVKAPPEKLLSSQVEWLEEFEYLPRKIACMFDSQESRDSFVMAGGFREMLEDPKSDSNTSRQEMASEEIASMLATVEPGDQILFNDRKRPLTVENKGVTEQVMTKDITGVRVASSNGSTVLSNDGKWYKGGMYRRDLWWLDIVGKSPE